MLQKVQQNERSIVYIKGRFADSLQHDQFKGWTIETYRWPENFLEPLALMSSPNGSRGLYYLCPDCALPKKLMDAE